MTLALSPGPGADVFSGWVSERKCWGSPQGPGQSPCRALCAWVCAPAVALGRHLGSAPVHRHTHWGAHLTPSVTFSPLTSPHLQGTTLPEGFAVQTGPPSIVFPRVAGPATPSEQVPLRTRGGWWGQDIPVTNTWNCMWPPRTLSPSSDRSALLRGGRDQC